MEMSEPTPEGAGAPVEAVEAQETASGVDTEVADDGSRIEMPTPEPLTHILIQLRNSNMTIFLAADEETGMSMVQKWSHGAGLLTVDRTASDGSRTAWHINLGEVAFMRQIGAREAEDITNAQAAALAGRAGGSSIVPVRGNSPWKT